MYEWKRNTKYYVHEFSHSLIIFFLSNYYKNHAVWFYSLFKFKCITISKNIQTYWKLQLKKFAKVIKLKWNSAKRSFLIIHSFSFFLIKTSSYSSLNDRKSKKLSLEIDWFKLKTHLTYWFLNINTRAPFEIKKEIVKQNYTKFYWHWFFCNQNEWHNINITTNNNHHFIIGKKNILKYQSTHAHTALFISYFLFG